ncbi:MAG TPA: DUF4367 domain-containing protein [Ilumatobacteraceae bacterium]|jgi:hypothetical protein
MAESLDHDAEMISALKSLGESLDASPPSDVVSNVRAAIDAEAKRRRKRRWRGAAAVAATASTLLIPGVRTAVAHRFGIGGVKVHEISPAETVPPVGTAFALGQRVDLDEARSAVDYHVLVAPGPDLPRPTVYLRDNGIVSFVYPATSTLPPSPGTDVGLIITEFSGDSRDIIEKFLNNTTDVEQLTVNGAHALWITRGDHFVFFINDKNQDVDVPGHIAGNTLLWVEGDVTIRLEGQISQADAVRIAESMS